MTNSDIFSNVQKRCRENGISIRQLERTCGIGNGSIYKWKVSSPSVDALKSVADFFHCTIDELIAQT